MTDVNEVTTDSSTHYNKYSYIEVILQVGITPQPYTHHTRLLSYLVILADKNRVLI